MSELLLGGLGGFVVGLALANLVRLLAFSRRQDKPLSSAQLQSLRVRHIQSRHWH